MSWFRRLIDADATVVVIEHDLDVIAAADYVIDMGPEGGEAGGRIVAVGTPGEIAHTPKSSTGYYLARHIERLGQVGQLSTLIMR